MLSQILERNRWKRVRSESRRRHDRIEIWKNPERTAYQFVVQEAADARPETIRGRFALALLEASSRFKSPTTVAVIEAPTISRKMLEELEEIAALSHGMYWAAVGADGRCVFHVPGLEAARHTTKPRNKRRDDSALPDPFSDRGLWITKVLMKRTLHRNPNTGSGRDWNAWMSGPTRYFETYDELAEATEVAPKTAWQTVHALEALGFVAGAAAEVPLVRIAELLPRIAGATRALPRTRPCRWILPRRNALQELLAGRLVVEDDLAGGNRARWNSARMCLAGFGAARALDLSVTKYRLDEIYVDKDVAIEDIGLAVAAPGERPDVLVHVPRRPEAVFRAAVVANGLATADIVQTWLDVADHPDRGPEQARKLLQVMGI